jgi:hypothetical protein
MCIWKWNLSTLLLLLRGQAKVEGQVLCRIGSRVLRITMSKLGKENKETLTSDSVVLRLKRVVNDVRSESSQGAPSFHPSKALSTPPVVFREVPPLSCPPWLRTSKTTSDPLPPSPEDPKTSLSASMPGPLAAKGVNTDQNFSGEDSGGGGVE